MAKNNLNLDNRYETKDAQGVDAVLLEGALKAVIEGEVRFDKGSKVLYATDGSNYRQVSTGVVIPKNEKDIIETTKSGTHSVMSQFYGYGARMSDNTESLTILTYDGLKMEVG